jgi:hypothetical protein
MKLFDVTDDSTAQIQSSYRWVIPMRSMPRHGSSRI